MRSLINSLLSFVYRICRFFQEANNLGLVPEFFMIGEPTELKFGRLQKGAVKVSHII